MIRSNDHQVKE